MLFYICVLTNGVAWQQYMRFSSVRCFCSQVLLARDTPASAAAVRDLHLDLSQWAPLIEDRAFVDWLVATPTEQVCASYDAHILPMTTQACLFLYVTTCLPRSYSVHGTSP